MRFAKLQALGNDFLVAGPGERGGWPVPAPSEALVRRLCDRRTGVGADGLILLGLDPARPGRFVFRIFNADGSEAEISGNGLRCAAAWLVKEGAVPLGRVVLETAVGERTVEVLSARGRVFEVRISLGQPHLASRDIPFDDGRSYDRIVDHPLAIKAEVLPVTCLSLGNPHCSLFFDRLPSPDERRALGSQIETHPAFPRRTNVEFARRAGPDELEVAFWERGVGETLSSGTGAAAAAAAAIIKRLVGRSVRVRTALGAFRVDWPEGGEISQTGPAELVFVGEIPLD